MNLLAESEIVIDAPISRVWKVLLDYSTWPLWDIHLESVSFSQPIANGVRGKIKPFGAPELDLEITYFSAEDRYLDQFVLLGSTFEFDHVVKLAAEGKATTVYFAMRGKGLLVTLLMPYFKSKYKKTLRQCCELLKRRIESNNFEKQPV